MPGLRAARGAAEERALVSIAACTVMIYVAALFPPRGTWPG
jgi:hypothetical protein